MATITTINASDLITDSRAVINTNFSNLNSDKIETSVLDTDTTLAANSDSKIATQKAIKAYVDGGGNPNASEISRGLVEQATASEIAARTTTGGSGAPLFINPGSLAYLSKFGGTGADGALTVTSGTTSIDLGGVAVVTKNYTSISITGTGAIDFTNPHANGSIIILKSQGAVTLTSSATPMISTVGDGSLNGYASGGTHNNGDPAITYNDLVVTAGNGADSGGGSDDGGGGGGSYFNAGANGVGGGGQGSGGAAVATLRHSSQFTPFAKVVKLWSGAGGGKGAEASGTGGDGGRGGGGLYIECGGAFNFTTASGISVAGAAGSNGTGGNCGGGGGGGAGSCVILYNTLTANSGTITVTGGAAGSGAGTGSAGGAGGLGNSYVGANVDFF
jgi:hypothetical protein